MKRAALFCISSLGLGHATRSIPVVRSYLDEYDVHIMSCGNALAYLRTEFGDRATYHEFGDYPPLERGKGSWRFYPYLVIDSLRTTAIIRREHRFVEALAARIDPTFIFSDGRYGSYVAGTPSFILSHQISFVMPRGFGAFGRLADHFNRATFERFDALFIPDYESAEESLAGKLSHSSMLRSLDHAFVGILSSCERREGERDIDILFTVSGYLLEHKQAFIERLMRQAGELPGKKVFVLGDANGHGRETTPKGIETYPSVSGALRADLFSRAKLLVSRGGYTTIMDLIELGIPGILVPTPGQTEQEYLSTHLQGRPFVRFMADKDFDISKAPIESLKAPQAPWRTAESVAKIRKIIGSRIGA